MGKPTKWWENDRKRWLIIVFQLGFSCCLEGRSSIIFGQSQIESIVWARTGLHETSHASSKRNVFGCLRCLYRRHPKNIWFFVDQKHMAVHRPKTQHTSIHINTPLELLANASSPSPFSCDFFTFPLGTFGRLNPVLFNEVSTQLPRDFVAVSTKAPTPLEDGRGYK